MQGRAQATTGGGQHPAREGGRYPQPQQNWVVKNLKLDFNKTDRRGYVQNRGVLSPKGGGRIPLRDPRGGRGPGLGCASQRGARRSPEWPPGGARPPSAPHPVPQPAPRQPGGGVSQGRPGGGCGSHLGGRRAGQEPPGPPCPLAPGRERREQDIPCPGTREGRAGTGRGAERSGPLPLPPGAGEPLRPPRPLSVRTP